MADATAMVDRCFRRQHPELWGGEEVPEPCVPVGIRYAPGELTSDHIACGVSLGEEPMGNGEALA